MSQGNTNKSDFIIADNSLSITKLLIDNSNIQENFNADTIHGKHIISTAPLGSGVSDETILTSKALRDFVYPIGCQYEQYPISASNTLLEAFPIDRTPAYMFGGSWTLMWSDQGMFFRTEKTGETGRVDGKQSQATALNGITLSDGDIHTHNQDHYHWVVAGTSYNYGGVTQIYPIAYHSTAGDNTEYTLGTSTAYGNFGANSGMSSAPVHSSSTGVGTDHNHAVSSTDTETRPINRIFKIWKRWA